MPELTIGMMITLTRNFAQEDAAVRAGGWQHTIGPGLSGTTLGVVGLGRLGVPVANLAQAFGMKVIAWSPKLTQARADPHAVRVVDKRELFSTADIITIHMPLSDASRNLIGAADPALMKPSAYLINTSRGPLVNEAALIVALRNGRIAGAGLDVYDTEWLQGCSADGGRARYHAVDGRNRAHPCDAGAETLRSWYKPRPTSPTGGRLSQ